MKPIPGDVLHSEILEHQRQHEYMKSNQRKRKLQETAVD
jgi:hypothetical protein